MIKPSPYLKKLEELTKQIPDVPFFLQHMFTQSHDMLVVADSKGHFTWVNQYTEDLLGYTREEIYSMDFMSMVHPDDVAKTKQVYEDLLTIEGFKCHSFSNRYMTKQGEEVPLCWNTTTVINGFIYCIGRHCELSRHFCKD